MVDPASLGPQHHDGQFIADNLALRDLDGAAYVRWSRGQTLWPSGQTGGDRDVA
jgi:hypothetical protein